ncbi:MAG: hypothetical protein IKT55_04045 [Clostridia bacterium]|nr:hypothetical protein [Clostridia bacterium]
MANCPKCGYKLRMIDIKAECPKCGVNLLYYNQQERLALDADKAEEEHIKMQPKIDRIKFAFVGTKLSIVRLISFLIPIGVMFLPLASVNVNMPWNHIDKDISILNVVMDIIMNLKFDILMDMITGSDLTRVAFIFYALSIVFILLAAVFAILNIPFDAVSCSPKGFKRNVTLSSCGIAFTVLSIVSFLVFNSQLTKVFGEIYSGSIGIGGFLVILGFAIIILVNVLIKKQNVPVKYTDVSEYVERIARRKEEIAEMEAQAALARKAYQERQEANK